MERIKIEYEMRRKNRFVQTLILALEMDPVVRILRKIVEDEAHLVRNFEHSINMICRDECDNQISNPECVEKSGFIKL